MTAPPTTKDLISLYVFKNNRATSTVKHTGLVFVREADQQWIIHEVGNDNDGQKAKLKTYPTTQEAMIKDCEDCRLAASFYASKEVLEDLLNSYDWKYNFLGNNCRDHVLHFLDKLEKEGISIHNDARKMIKDTKIGDMIIGSALIGFLCELLF